MAGNTSLGNTFEQWRKLNAIAEAAAQEHGVDPNVIKSMIRQESMFDPAATSKKGAQGVMQLMPATAAELGVTDPNDPEQNIKAGTKYFASLMKRYKGDTATALAAYNAGMGNVDKGKAMNFPETQDYVQRITSGIQSRAGDAAAGPTTYDSVDLTAKPKAPEVPLGSVFEQWKAGQEQPQEKPVVAKPESPGLFSRLKNHPLDTVADELPTIGGAVGALFGPAGAAAGGAAGKGYRDLYQHASELPGALHDVFIGDGGNNVKDTAMGFLKGAGTGAKDTAIEAAIQGATEVGGKIIGKGLNTVGRGLVKKAFRPVVDTPQEMTAIVDSLVKEGINPTLKGVATVDARTTASKKAAETLVEDAWQPKTLPNGVRITPKKVPTKEVLNALETHPYSTPDKPVNSATDFIKTQFEKGPLYRRLDSYWDNVIADNPKGLTYPQLLALRRGEGKAASKVFEGAIENPGMEAQLHTGMEAGSRKALEDRVPGFAKQNDETQRLLRVLETAQGAVKARASGTPSVVRHGLAAVPGIATGAAFGDPVAGLLTWLATEAATNPTVQAVTGRGLTKVAKVPFGQVIRAGEAAVKEKSNTRKATKKTKVDSLYSRYQNED